MQLTYIDRRGVRPFPVLILLAMFAMAAAISGSASASSLRRTAVVTAYENAKLSVVNIHGRKNTVPDQIISSDDIRPVNGMGTGVVVDERGYILTNSHVVDGVGKILVTLVDESTVTARLIANDPASDLAVIKINVNRPMRVIPVGTSHDLMRGEPVIAIGNAFGYTHTVSEGIISALHRSVQISEAQKYDNLIQTSASINPGNSGGPLLNIDGEMIGINVAVRVGAQGIGFALPVDDAMQAAARLMSVERLDRKQHGIVAQTVNLGQAKSKLVVKDVRPGSPADEVGLRAGDVIARVGGRPVYRLLDLERSLLDRESGEPVDIKVVRSNQSIVKQLVLRNLGPSSEPSIARRAWEQLGLQVQPMTGPAFKKLGTRYRGGLRISAVRPQSPADKQGIRRGDILVGLHKWETVSLENVAYILDSDELADKQPAKFFILRGSETLYGFITVLQP